MYHGSDVASAGALAGGAPLSAQAATTLKIDGPPGFYLATSRSDAEFFAARRAPGAIIELNVSEEAVRMLLDAGATIQPIPVTDRSPFFEGQEMVVPPEAFALFDRLRVEGEIVVHPLGS